MKRLLAFIPLAVLLALPMRTRAIAEYHSAESSPSVYICTSPKAYAYHSNSKCSALNRCNYSIKKVPLSSARSQGRSACGKCY